jgi:capsule polysaccharide export protein KpsE/RkpR
VCRFVQDDSSTVRLVGFLRDRPHGANGDATLNTEEDLQSGLVEEEPDSEPFPTRELLTALLQRRRLLATVVSLGLLASIGVAFVIPKQYTSTAQLMPPDNQTFASSSMLTALSGLGGGLLSAGGGGFLNQRTPGSTCIGILTSRTTLDDIINRFDLRKVYHRKLYLDTRKILLKRTVIAEDKKSGIIAISVTDNDPNRAREIAGSYIEELDKLVNSLSTSSARRERVFLEQRLKAIKDDLDTSSRALSQFSSRNATMDIQKQGEATVEAAGKLQGELIAAESELSGLKAQYTDDNVRVRAARGRVNELQSQLRKMSGVGEDVDAASLDAGQLFPSIRKLPLLGLTYYDLYRQVAMEESLYEALSKQYELAKVQEAKEIPPIKVLDAPDLPEKKSLPHRSIVILVGLLLSAFAGIGWIVAGKLWELTDDSHPAKAFGTELWRSIRRRSPAMTD